jgi:glycosyltransferase involved in cell wall biosynthesis
LKLVHTTQYYWPFIGGAEKYCQIVSEGLTSEHEVSLYTTDVVSIHPLNYSTKLLELKSGVRITRLSSMRCLAGMYGRNEKNNYTGSLFQSISSLDTELTWPQMLFARALSSSILHRFLWLNGQVSDADFLVLFNVVTGMTSLSYAISRFKRKPFIIFPMFHVGLWAYETSSVLRILRDATLAICSTDYERQALIDRGVDPLRLIVVNEGVTEPEVNEEIVDRLKPLFNKKERHLILMYIGRRNFNKGYFHLLSAVSWLFRKGFPLKLVICGQGQIGKNVADYNFLSEHNAIIDFGVANERTKIAAMSLCDVIILPSRAETYPLVFVESWLLGKPVIGARIGSVSSIVREGIDGLLVEFGNIKDLIAAIKLLFNDPGRRAEMGKNGWIRAKAQLTIDKSVKKIVEIFQELPTGVTKK